ncbi:MAG: hypothetical protein R2874_08460 [Desulfobacterales bacterium]
MRHLLRKNAPLLSRTLARPIAATGDLERTVIISPPKKAAENHPPPTSLPETAS